MELLLKSCAINSSEVSNLHSQSKTKLEPTHCRFCAKQFAYGELLDLTQIKDTLEEYNNMMEFLKIDYIDFTNSALPKTTCEACYNAFHGAYDFLLSTKESQAILNRLYCETLDEKAVNSSEINPQTDTNNSDDILSVKTYEETIEINNHEDMNKICEKTETRSISDQEDVTNINDLNSTAVDDCISVTSKSATSELTISKIYYYDFTERCNNVPVFIEKDPQALLNRLYCETFDEVPVNTSEIIKPHIKTNNSDDVSISKKLCEETIGVSNHEDMNKICEETEPSINDQEDVSNVNDTNNSTVNNDQEDVFNVNDTNNSTVDNDQEDVFNSTADDDCISITSESDSCISNLNDFALGMQYYNNVPVFIENEAPPNDDIESWADYPWNCLHCGIQFDNMTELREHSKALHDHCYAFKCIDCKDVYNTFNSFVEHVREHRDDLSNYCQYCNLEFDEVSECIEHALTHWDGGQKICNLCGEICPDAESLDLHRKLYYKRVRIRTKDMRNPKTVCPAPMYNGIVITLTWDDYDWTCQDCLVRMPDIATLRKHIREYHNKCFSMKCVDCLKVNWNYYDFVKHVAIHRIYLRQYCPYCNKHFVKITDMKHHIKDHMVGDQKPCDGCGEIFETKELRKEHMSRFKPHLRNGSRTTEDMTCDICLKQFKSRFALDKHIQIHKERQRSFICETCGKTYYDRGTLEQHVHLVHTAAAVKTDKCEFCKMVFRTRKALKLHVQTHLNKRTFICNECGKGFNSKCSVRWHIYRHMGTKNFKCTICHKQYSTSSILKTHMYTHNIGSSPFECKQCVRKFTNWSNCNKHMIRIHGTTLAKTKQTAWGKIAINKATGKAKKVVVSSETKKWMEDVVNSKKEKRGKKKSK